MSVSELRVELPDTLSKDEARMLLAVKLFEVEKISLGQAAKIADLSKRAFMEVLGRHSVPVFSYSPEDLRRELES
jgi:predicted HTH domain antitoxin